MQDATARELRSTPAGHSGLQDCGEAELFTESLDPNEIRIALSELHGLMSRIRSVVIGRDLRTAYDRIAGITVVERLPGLPSAQKRPVPCRR